jgi:hypothetical protein
VLVEQRLHARVRARRCCRAHIEPDYRRRSRAL